MDHASRAAVVGVLLVATFAMGVYYGRAGLRHWPYPDDELATGDESHFGERTLLSGTVDSVEPDEGRARVVVDADAGEFAMTVTGVDGSVEPGGRIQVFGTLRSDWEIRAERVVVEPSSGSTVYTYLVSLVGAALVLPLSFCRWEIDRETLSVTPR